MKIFGMDSKKLALWLVIIGAAAAVLSGLALVFSGLPQSIRDGREWPVQKEGGKGSPIDESFSFPAGGIEGIDVSLSFEDAVIGVSLESGGESGEIGVRYSGFAVLPVDGGDVFTAEVKSGHLVIESDWTGYALRNARMKLEVTVPAQWPGNLSFTGASGNLELKGFSPAGLDVRLASGDMMVTGLKCESAFLKNSSGTIRATDFVSGSARITAVSGDINLADLNIRDVLEAGTASGDITAEGVAAGEIQGRAVSGDVILTRLSGALQVKNTSGDVEVSMEVPGDRVDISSTSGSVRLALPADASFSLKAGTVSGSMRSDFPVTVTGEMNSRKMEGVVGDSPMTQVDLGSTSGNIVIEKR